MRNEDVSYSFIPPNIIKIKYELKIFSKLECFLIKFKGIKFYLINI